MSRNRKNHNAVGFRWMVFLIMIVVAVVIAARGGALKDPFTTPVELLRNSDTKSAVIKDCVSKVIVAGAGGAMRGSKSKKTLYATRAYNADGASARGSYFFGWQGPEWCEAKLGEEVKVRIHKSDPSLNRIDTFTGLWYVPFQILLALFWLIIASRVKPLAWAVLGLNLIAIPALFMTA